MGNYYQDYNRQMEAINARTYKAITYGNEANVQPMTIVELNNLANFMNPLRAEIAREFYAGPSVSVRRVTPTADALSWKGSTGDAFDETTIDPVKKVFPYKTAGTQMKIYQDEIDDGRGFVDVLKEQIDIGMERIKNDEDKAMTVLTCSSTQPDGLSAQVGYIIPNCTSAGGDVLDLDMFHYAMRKMHGVGLQATANMIIMNYVALLQLQELLYDQQSVFNMVNIPSGFQLISFNGVPIFISSNIPLTETFNGTCNTSETGSNCTQVLFLQKEYFKCYYNRALYTQPIGVKSSQYLELDMRMRSVYVLRNPYKATALQGIVVSSKYTT